MIQHRPLHPAEHRDRGSVLTLTIILTSVLAIVAISIATYVTTGLRNSNAVSDRLEASMAAEAGFDYWIEELTHKRVMPCSTSGPITIPSGIAGASTVTGTCVPVTPIEGHSTVIISVEALTTAEVRSRVVATVQVPALDYTTRIVDWSS
jgi:Tfp pilus assembly protein PilX